MNESEILNNYIFKEFKGEIDVVQKDTYSSMISPFILRNFSCNQGPYSNFHNRHYILSNKMMSLQLMVFTEV